MTIPTFSVLMSVYAKEQPEYLEAALRSVFDQTLPPDEVVLVKDGPLPEALENVIASYAHRHSALRAIALAQNIGLGAALNAGLRHCTHEVVARMDTDDLCVRHRFEAQIPLFSANDTTAVVGSWISEFEHDPDIADSVRKVPEHNAEIVRRARTRCPVNHPTVVFRKSAVQSVGGYNAKHLQEDYYLWVRLMLAGHRFYNVQDSLVKMRTGAGLYDRRGGLHYALAELRLFFDFYRLGFIGLRLLLVNIATRTAVRLFPASLRKSIYLRFARSKVPA